MNRFWLRLDNKLKHSPAHFILQTLLAFVSLAIILSQIGLLGRGVLVAALGSSIFVAFLTPAAYTARARNIIGSHALSGAIGIGFHHLIAVFPENYSVFILLSAASVALSMFVMVATDTEHPPAAGTALGLSMEGSLMSFLFISISVIALVIIKRLLDPWLEDLV